MFGLLGFGTVCWIGLFICFVYVICCLMIVCWLFDYLVVYLGQLVTV